jgi:hypothetical protein
MHIREIEKIKSQLSWIEKAESEAKRLSAQIPDGQLYIGIVGIDLKFNSCTFINGLATLRKVTNPPGFVFICSAANLNFTEYLGVSRYSSNIQAELVVDCKNIFKTQESEFVLNIAWSILSLLKLRSQSNLLCPIYANKSWDTIASIKDNSVIFGILDDIPKRIAHPSLSKVTKEDIAWVQKNLSDSLALRNREIGKRFSLAYNIFYEWNHTSNPRIALANLWCGLEALYGKQNDRPVTEKLLNRLCEWIGYTDRNYVRLLYKSRCDAVHGRVLSQEELLKMIFDSEKLLKDSLIRCVEVVQQPLQDWVCSNH